MNIEEARRQISQILGSKAVEVFDDRDTYFLMGLVDLLVAEHQAMLAYTLSNLDSDYMRYSVAFAAVENHLNRK